MGDAPDQSGGDGRGACMFNMQGVCGCAMPLSWARGQLGTAGIGWFVQLTDC
jgi:hypothetical protein